MRFYDGLGPNPLAVRLALAEKGLTPDTAFVDMVAKENRTPEFYAKVPTGTLPALEFDDGFVLSEITAIAEWLDEAHPEPALIGSNARERAETRMWARRLDLEICMPLGIGFQAGRARAFFLERKTLPCEQAAEDFLKIGCERLAWLEGTMAGHDWVCGERFSWADLPLFCFLEFFGRRGKQEDLYPHGGWLDGWRDRVRTRPAIAAALAAPQPAAKAA
jgi:glutathione S-transferase